MTELEKKIKAKIPGEDTGIEVKRTLCAICSPGNHCGIDCYVKDGKLLKVEGTLEHPYNKGKICTKGASNRDYIYRKDRIQTPLKRVGARGEGKFEPISWEEAYRIIAENLNKVKEQYSPHSVAFFSGFCKWYRPILHRFCYTFGSVNFGTDDSTCFKSTDICHELTTGNHGNGPNLPNANTFLGWNYNGYYSNHLAVPGAQAFKAKGGKMIIIDTRITPAAKNLADIFIQIRPGTDGALALGMGKIIIDNGWADMDYIEKNTYGFEQYKELVQKYPLDKVCEITGADPDAVMEATKLFATNGPAAINFSASALAHRTNGFQTNRAILCLSALTGNYDRAGGNVPSDASYLHKRGGFKTREMQFREEKRPHDQLRIGETRFPAWDEYCDEFQAMDLLRQIETGEPYPIKAIVGFGFNAKMYPETDKLVKAFDKLDFFVDADMFMSYTTRFADIVLPSCSSLERGELKAYEGGYLVFTQPVIPPLYESRSDVDMMCDLARIMDLDDDLLKAGYEACCDWMIEPTGLTVAELKKSDLPTKVQGAKMPPPGTYTANGFKTRSGKFEFYSTAIASYDPKYGLNPLPDYVDPLEDQNDPETRANYPFHLIAGVRIPNTLHSRLHEVPWLRSLRPEPLVEIQEDDAKRLGIKEGDKVELSSPAGAIHLKAMLTNKIMPGVLVMAHGYTEANANELIPRDHLDPYTGYPGFKSMRCAIRKED